MAKWKSKGTPGNVLKALDKHLEAARKNTSFINAHYERIEIIDGLLDLDQRIPRSYRSQVVGGALKDALPRVDGPDVLLQAVSAREREYLSRPASTFHLITDISISPSLHVPVGSVHGVRISSRAKAIRAARSARAQAFADKRFALRFEQPTGYTELAATVLARTEFEAAEKALDALDLWRGWLNLAVNLRSGWRQSTATTEPVNRFVLGPFHTVHKSDGAVASDTFWFDPNHRRAQLPYSARARFDEAIKWSRSMRSRLNRCSLMTEVEAALLRYVRALDEANMNEAFLRLWSLLEYLTGRPERNEVAIRRAAFIFRDRAMTEIALQHLRDQRNAFVHSSSDLGRPEMLVFMLKRYVEGLLRFFILSGKTLRNMGEAIALLDSPTDIAVIEERMARLRLVRRLMSQ